MLTIAQVDLFQAQLQTKMLEVAIEQAKAELDDDIECANVHQCTYRFLSIYFAVFTNPLFNYTMAQTEAMINWISGVVSLNQVVPVSFTDFTIINIGSDHTHTISQVIGLQAVLDDLQFQIDNLEDAQITEVDGGTATRKILITIRNDNTFNWERVNPILEIGEMGFAIDNGIVTGIKIGLGDKWKDTPYHFSPFKPIVTSNGRNLDATYGGPPYNAQHNFQTETEAWAYVLTPYAPPYITFPYLRYSDSKYIIWDAQVGDSVEGEGINNYVLYNFTVFNTSSILLEGETQPKQKLYYVSTIYVPVDPTDIAEGNVNGHLLDDQDNNIVGQDHSELLIANNDTAGLVEVFSAYIKGSVNPGIASSVYGATVYVRFRLLSSAFLWKARPNGDGTYSSELLDGTYDDAELSGIIRTMNYKQDGLVYPIMGDDSGSKNFVGAYGLLPFNSDLFSTPPPPAANGATGVFHMIVAAPSALGTPVVYSSMGTGNGDGMTLYPTRLFTYTNGTANIQYGLYVVMSVISGPMQVNIR